MAIDEKKTFVVTCDTCKESMDISGEGGWSGFDTPEEAKLMAETSEWSVQENGYVECLDCFDKRIREIKVIPGGAT